MQAARIMIGTVRLKQPFKLRALFYKKPIGDDMADEIGCATFKCVDPLYTKDAAYGSVFKRVLP